MTNKLWFDLNLFVTPFSWYPISSYSLVSSLQLPCILWNTTQPSHTAHLTQKPAAPMCRRKHCTPSNHVSVPYTRPTTDPALTSLRHEHFLLTLSSSLAVYLSLHLNIVPPSLSPHEDLIYLSLSHCHTSCVTVGKKCCCILQEFTLRVALCQGKLTEQWRMLSLLCWGCLIGQLCCCGMCETVKNSSILKLVFLFPPHCLSERQTLYVNSVSRASWACSENFVNW